MRAPGQPLVFLACLAASCAPAPTDARLPAEGLDRIEYAVRTGPHELRYTFTNDTGASLAAPEVFTSCACHAAGFEPAEIAPGGRGVLSLRAELQPSGLVEGTAILRWEDGVETELRWTVALERFRGLQVSPPGVRAKNLARAERFRCAFLASSGAADAGPPSLTVTRGEHRYPAHLVWSEAAGVGLVKGEASISIPPGAPGEGPLLVRVGEAATELEVF